MKIWTGALALTVAGAMLAGAAFAQGTTPSGDQKDKSNQPGGSATTSPGGADATKKSDSQTDKMKSDTGTKADKGTKADTGMKAGKSDSAAKSNGKSAAAGGGNQQQVTAVQQALKDKGHDPGMIDGVMGPKTQAALRDFQKKEGLKESGRLDAETMAKLGVDTKTSTTGSASPASPSASSPSSSPSASPSGSSSGAPSSTGSSAPSASGSDATKDTKKDEKK